MNRYRIRISVDGKRKLYYIEDQENYDIVLLPSKYLKHKADANRSPNTVRRLALSICYYLNYLDQTGTELLQVLRAVPLLAGGGTAYHRQSNSEDGKWNLQRIPQGCVRVLFISGG